MTRLIFLAYVSTWSGRFRYHDYFCNRKETAINQFAFYSRPIHVLWRAVPQLNLKFIPKTFVWGIISRSITREAQRQPNKAHLASLNSTQCFSNCDNWHSPFYCAPKSTNVSSLILHLRAYGFSYSVCAQSLMAYLGPSHYLY